MERVEGKKRIRGIESKGKQIALRDRSEPREKNIWQEESQEEKGHRGKEKAEGKIKVPTDEGKASAAEKTGAEGRRREERKERMKRKKRIERMKESEGGIRYSALLRLRTSFKPVRWMKSTCMD
jgi:hypothetical protein